MKNAEMCEEKIIFIYEPKDKFKFLEANRHTRPDHVKSLMGAMLRGEWIPPIYVTKDGYIVDGQNRYKAFCNLCKEKSSSGIFLRYLVINSDEDAIILAIRFNTGQRRWLVHDYFHLYVTRKVASYEKLASFMELHPHLKGVRAALQIIKGSYGYRVFQAGSLQISDSEICDATVRMKHLHDIYLVTGEDRVFKRDIVVAFYNVFEDAVKDWTVFMRNIKTRFHAPQNERCKDWTAAYRSCL